MSKYFNENKTKRISLKNYLIGLEKEQDKLKYARVKHIYESLGDVLIREDMIDILCETFDSSKCRYGTICLKKETIVSIYEISELFPEISNVRRLLRWR